MDKKEYLWKDKKRTIFGLPLSFTTYAFDNERFYIKRGFLTIKKEEVRLYRIMDLSFRQTLGQRIFGVGSILCESADKTMKNFEIKNIKDSENVMEKLLKLVEEERERKRVSSREYLHDDDFDDGDN